MGVYVVEGTELLDRGRGYVSYFVGVYSTVDSARKAIERDNLIHNKGGENLVWNAGVSLPPVSETRILADSRRDDGVLVHYAVHHVIIDRDFGDDFYSVIGVYTSVVSAIDAADKHCRLRRNESGKVYGDMLAESAWDNVKDGDAYLVYLYDGSLDVRYFLYVYTLIEGA